MQATATEKQNALVPDLLLRLREVRLPSRSSFVSGFSFHRGLQFRLHSQQAPGRSTDTRTARSDGTLRLDCSSPPGDQAQQYLFGVLLFKKARKLGFNFIPRSMASQAIPSVQTRFRRNSCAGTFFLRPSSAIAPVQSGRTFRCALRVACHPLDEVGTICHSLSFSFTPGKRKGSWGPLLRLTGKTVCGNLRLCFLDSRRTCCVTCSFGSHSTLHSHSGTDQGTFPA